MEIECDACGSHKVVKVLAVEPKPPEAKVYKMSEVAAGKVPQQGQWQNAVMTYTQYVLRCKNYGHMTKPFTESDQLGSVIRGVKTEPTMFTDATKGTGVSVRIGKSENKHTQGNDMADERPDDPQKPVESVQSPPQEAGVREAIRQANHGGIDADGSTDTDRIMRIISTTVDGLIPAQLSTAYPHEIPQPAVNGINQDWVTSYENNIGWNMAVAEMQRRRKELGI